MQLHQEAVTFPALEREVEFEYPLVRYKNTATYMEFSSDFSRCNPQSPTGSREILQDWGEVRGQEKNRRSSEAPNPLIFSTARATLLFCLVLTYRVFSYNMV